MTEQTFRLETSLPVTADQAYRWHMRPGAVDRMLPPWQPIRVDGPRRGIEEGSEVEFELGRSPFSIRWRARHENVRPGRGFSDRQIDGPFHSWLHRRDFEDTGSGGSRLVETIRYELPHLPLSTPLAGSSVRRALERTFAYRHRTLRADLATHRRYASQRPLRVAVTGASGLIGSALTALLTTGGHEVIRLVRQRETAPDEVRWDPEAGVLQPDRLEGLDAVVHLAGENIAAGRWTDARKEAILRSRIRGTSNLVASLRDLETPPRAFLCASAVGFYGETGSDERTEEAGRGEGFLSDVCVAWEAAAGAAAELAERVALLRFGVVLSPRGGALAKMLPAFRFGAGGVVGSGRQYLSWISLDDVARAILHALVTPEVEGPLNVVAPQPCTNRELTHQVGSVLRRPTIAPLPRPAVRALFGEMGEAMLLGSTRVAPAKLVQTGFAFAHSELEDCLRHCLGRATPRNAFERAAGLNDQEAT